VAKPTHDEIIRELSREAAVLNERVNTIREEVKELKQKLEQTGRLSERLNSVGEELK
jgi:hypothetical protein